ncbi:transposable element Tcb2 transposase [Trichonephila clavipes]|nr:transposable element Tcb2 transposase [Trichonephila clavipes]
MPYNHENPPNWAGVEPATTTNHATQPNFENPGNRQAAACDQTWIVQRYPPVHHQVHPHVQDLEPFLETGNASRRPRQGRRWATTPNEDRYLVLTARRHRNMNATLLQQHLRSATDTTVSTQTVRNRLHGVGMYARRPMVCVKLTSRHRRDCREWATEHVNWRRNEWSNVLFSDESRFSVHPDNRRIFI